MIRKAAIALSGVVVVGVLLLFALKARSGSSEPSGSGSQTGTPAGDAGATAEASDAGPSRPHWSSQEDPKWIVGLPMRPMDRDIIAALESGTIDRKDELDLFPDRPYKVRLAGNPTTQMFAYVLVDLNRDDKWDEKWDLTQPGEIKRTVFHDPDAQGQQMMYTMTKGRWQLH